VKETEKIQGLEFLNYIKERIDNDDFQTDNPFEWISSEAGIRKIPPDWTYLANITEFFHADSSKKCGAVGLYKSGIKFNLSHIQCIINKIDNDRVNKKFINEKNSERKESLKRLEELKQEKLLRELTELEIKNANIKNQVKRIFPLSLFTDAEIISEIRKRGFVGKIEIIKII